MKQNIVKKILLLILILSSTISIYSQVMTEVQYFEKDYDIPGGLGGSLSVADNFAMAGCSSNSFMGSYSGCVFVYKKVGNQWIIYDSIYSPTPGNHEGFGFTVEMNDEFAFISALGDWGDVEGTVYIFKNNAGIWSYEATFSPDTIDVFGAYGLSIDLFEDYAIVGSPYSKIDIFSNAGSAYIYFNNGGTWEKTQRLIASDPNYSSFFGQSVSIMGNYAFIGAHGNNTNGSYSGAVYVFEYKDTVWVETQILNPSDASEYDRFGFSVEHYDNYAVIGSYTKDGAELENGAAYIFEKIDTVWYEKEKLFPPEIDEQANFGSYVKINDQFLVIGAPGVFGGGRAYLYKFEVGNWNYLLNLDNSKEYTHDFGGAIGLYNDFIFIGSRNSFGFFYSYSDIFYIYNIQSPVFTLQPEKQIEVCPFTSQNIHLEGIGINNYQWQLKTERLGTYYDISDINPYSGTNTNSLNISSITSDFDTYYYRCVVSNLVATTYSYNFNYNVGVDMPTIECRLSATIEPTSGYDYYIAPETIFEPTKMNYCGNGTLYNSITQSDSIIGVKLPIGDTIITWTIIDGKGDSASCTQNIAVQIAGINNVIYKINKELHVFPNPCTDLLNINFQNFEQGNIQVFDLTGKNLKNSTFKGLNNKIDITDLKSGLYLIRIDTGKEVFNMKICKN